MLWYFSKRIKYKNVVKGYDTIESTKNYILAFSHLKCKKTVTMLSIKNENVDFLAGEI